MPSRRTPAVSVHKHKGKILLVRQGDIVIWELSIDHARSLLNDLSAILQEIIDKEVDTTH